MTVAQLFEKLKDVPKDAVIRIDDEGYPFLEITYMPGDVFEDDPEDAPPPNSVLLGFAYEKN